MFYDEGSVEELTQEDDILGIIQERLTREMNNVNSPFHQYIVQRCTLILQNILLTKANRIHKKIHSHPVWDFLYHTITDEHPLLPTVTLSEYYFRSLGR